MGERYEQSQDRYYLEEMLNNFARATDLNIAAVNTYGEIFLASRSYQECAYCKYVQSTEEGRRQCERTYRKACKQAFKWKEPYFFVCHAGLVMWGLPIRTDGVEVGAVMCGQVLLWEPDEVLYQDAQRFCNSEKEQEQMRRLIRELPVISVEQCQSSANLLAIMIQYLSNTSNTIFMEQKNLLNWRNAVISRIEERKKEHENVKFDWSVYLKREKRYLQYVRMGDREKIQDILPILFTDIEILSSHDGVLVRSALLDFMAVTMRAVIEAGADCEAVQPGMNRYRKIIQQRYHVEEMMEVTYQMLNQWFDSIYLLGSNEHISVLKSVKDYIDENFDKKLSLDDISASVFLSKSYLCTLFRQKMNSTINDYILRVRVEKSIELMKNRELSINSIMKQCGFESQSYYTKVFRRLIGVTPGQYRNKFL